MGLRWVCERGSGVNMPLAVPRARVADVPERRARPRGCEPRFQLAVFVTQWWRRRRAVRAGLCARPRRVVHGRSEHAVASKSWCKGSVHLFLQIRARLVSSTGSGASCQHTVCPGQWPRAAKGAVLRCACVGKGGGANSPRGSRPRLTTLEMSSEDRRAPGWSVGVGAQPRGTVCMGAIATAVAKKGPALVCACACWWPCGFVAAMSSRRAGAGMGDR